MSAVEDLATTYQKLTCEIMRIGQVIHEIVSSRTNTYDNKRADLQKWMARRVEIEERLRDVERQLISAYSQAA